jgi:hypothetical protein
MSTIAFTHFNQPPVQLEPGSSEFYAAFDFVFSRALLTRSERSFFALSNSDLRDLLSPLPARLMKYVSILIPDPGPFGETFFDASCRAIVSASLVNNPSGG